MKSANNRFNSDASPTGSAPVKPIPSVSKLASGLAGDPQRLGEKDRIMTKLNWRFLAVLSSALTLIGCTNDTWDCHIYPDRNDLRKFRYVGRFDSLQACRAGALSELERLHRLDAGDYECGKNCKGDPLAGDLVCEETMK